MGRKERYGVEEIAEALVRSRGNKRAAAKRLGCSEGTVFAYCHRHPELWKVGRLARMRLVDKAESALVKLVKAGQWNAIRFVLWRLGRERGYQLRSKRRVGDPVANPEYVHIEEERMAAALATYGDDQQVLTGRCRTVRRRGGRPFLFTPEEVADALRRANGMKAGAARLLGCGRATVYNYCARYPKVMEAGDNARELLLDEAELQTMKLVDERYLPAVMFVLETLGADRGYGREQIAPPEGDVRAEMLAEFEERLMKAYGEEKGD